MLGTAHRQSVTCAVLTAITCGNPSCIHANVLFDDSYFLARIISLVFRLCARPVFFTLCASTGSRTWLHALCPCFPWGRAKLIFLINARASRLIPSSPAACHLANDAYILLHSSGKLARQCPSLGTSCANNYSDLRAKQLI